MNRLWANLEIVLGLATVDAGLLLGDWAVSRRGDPDIVSAAGGLALFVLGGYLAMAGHRSHLYQSNNELAAYLTDLIRSGKRNEAT